MPQPIEAQRRLQIEARHLEVLQSLLKQHVPHAEVWAYGSRVSGRSHEGSDLDLVLRNPLDLTQDVEGRDELMAALQDSPLPMLVEAQVWSRLPASFLPNIEEAHVTVQTP